jgi:hypothetical protein
MSSSRRARPMPCVFFGLAALALPLTAEIEQAVGARMMESLSPSIAVEIGETSSTELPIADALERPPVSGTPLIQKLRRGASDQ